jgi:hypothetical protein
MLTTVGRAGFGLDQAWSSRYLFHSGTLIVGLIAAFNVHRLTTFRVTKDVDRYTNVFCGIVLVLLILGVRTWNHGGKMFELMKIARTQDLLTVRLMTLAPGSPMVDKISAGTDLPTLVRTLIEKHIYDPSQFGMWLSDALRGSPLEANGIVESTSEGRAEITVAGWGMIPDENRPADSVLICRPRHGGDLEPWMMFAVGRKRVDVVQETGHKSLLRSGFMETFPWKEGLPTPSISAFAVDERRNQLYRISSPPKSFIGR